MIQFLIHEKADTVGVATVDIKQGETAQGLYMDSQEQVTVKVLQDIPLGHKIAMKEHKPEDTVLKYGYDIGKVVANIEVGDSPERLTFSGGGLRLCVAKFASNTVSMKFLGKSAKLACKMTHLSLLCQRKCWITRNFQQLPYQNCNLTPLAIRLALMANYKLP